MKYSLGIIEKFNLTYEELINNSQNTRLAKKNKKNGTNIIPRRQNAWILYLRDKSREMSGFSSKEIAKMWNDEPKEISKTSRIPITPPTTPPSKNSIQFPIVTPPENNNINDQFQILEFVPSPSEPDNINYVQFPDNFDIMQLMQNCEECRSYLQGLPNINFEIRATL
ncbi:unnamed protein product [Rhizophagus irregularis]|nr:unnamed protein product [Rhizophagus irregularis]